MEAAGFVPNKVYDVHDLDSVNTFNGNLVVTVPIGPTFHVNGALSYGLALHYNSHAWTYWNDLNVYDPRCNLTPPGFICYESHSDPSLRSNVALGWSLSLGRLWGPGDPLNTLSSQKVSWLDGFTYEDPDGATHPFNFLVVNGVTQRTEPVGTLLSTDGSYMRFREPDSTHVYIDSRDGITREFDKNEALSSPWRLVKISDATGNHVDIAYSSDNLKCTIGDVARPLSGSTANPITVQFAYYGSNHLYTVLQSITMPA